MRLLVDVHGLDFEAGLGYHPPTPSPTPTTRCCPKRLKRWPVPLFERLLPRHMQIVYAINAKILPEARKEGSHRPAILATSR